MFLCPPIFIVISNIHTSQQAHLNSAIKIIHIGICNYENIEGKSTHFDILKMNSKKKMLKSENQEELSYEFP